MNNYNLTEYDSILHNIQYAFPKSQLADGVAKILLGSQFKEEKTNDESTYQFIIDPSNLKEAEPYMLFSLIRSSSSIFSRSYLF